MLSSGGDRWQIPPLPDDKPWSSANAVPTLGGRAGDTPTRVLRGLACAAPVDPATIETVLGELAEWASVPRPSRRVLLTWQQLREFATLSGLRLGAHTLTHPDLPSCSPEDAPRRDRRRRRLDSPTLRRRGGPVRLPLRRVDSERRPPGRRAWLPRRLHDRREGDLVDLVAAHAPTVTGRRARSWRVCKAAGRRVGSLTLT